MSDPERSGIVNVAVQEFFKAPLHRSADTRPDFHTVIKAVFWEDNAAGMVRLEDVQRLTAVEPEAKMKILGVKKDEQSPPVLPISAAVDSGTYLFSPPCYLYMDTKQVGRMARQLFSSFAKRGGKP